MQYHYLKVTCISFLAPEFLTLRISRHIFCFMYWYYLHSFFLFLQDFFQVSMLVLSIFCNQVYRLLGLFVLISRLKEVAHRLRKGLFLVHDLVLLQLKGISWGHVNCCSRVHRECGLTVDVILVCLFLVSWRKLVWPGLAMLELNSHYSTLNLVLSQSALIPKFTLNLEHGSDGGVWACLGKSSANTGCVIHYLGRFCMSREKSFCWNKP